MRFPLRSQARKVEEYGLRHPVMIDNDFSYWRAIGTTAPGRPTI